MTASVSIRTMQPDDWTTVARIYQEGIDTGNATFQQEVPGWGSWDTGHLAACRLIAETENEIVGWAALSPVSSRPVYAGVAEVSVYVALRFQGQGIGSYLLGALISASERHGIWTLQAGIFPENRSSIKIHEAHGFRQVGRREKIGAMNGVWRDTILMERRSRVV